MPTLTRRLVLPLLALLLDVVLLAAEAEKQVYLVAKTTDGKWAGLKTTVVET